jgi:hypothetical protein
MNEDDAMHEFIGKLTLRALQGMATMLIVAILIEALINAN